jgi:hypothetical protein
MAEPAVVTTSSFVTVHLARFDQTVTIDQTRTAPTSGDPMAWMVGTDYRAAGTAPGAQQGSEWVALGLHAEVASAVRVFDAGVDAVPYFAGAAESWSGVLEPISHRGEANWLDTGRPGPAFAPVARRLSGPFMVITSVGWVFDDRFDPANAADFAYGVERVRAGMGGTDGLHSQQSFAFPSLAADGITITFWRDDAAMRAFAYRPGEHKFQLDRYRELGTADRTSFTRLEVLDQRGTWLGGDPSAW